MTPTPSSVRSFHILGNEWDLPTVPISKRRVPPVSDARAAHVADTLGPAKRERIKADAQEAAAEVMAAWERKKGRG